MGHGDISERREEATMYEIPDGEVQFGIGMSIPSWICIPPAKRGGMWQKPWRLDAREDTTLTTFG